MLKKLGKMNINKKLNFSYVVIIGLMVVSVFFSIIPYRVLMQI